MKEKKTLRSDIRKSLKNLSTSERSSYSASLSGNLMSLLAGLNLHRHDLGGFANTNTEPDWNNCLSLGPNWSLAFPFVDSKDEMHFYECSFSDLVKPDALPYRIPSVRKKLIVPNVILVPGIGYTRLGERLGQGGGYYDRYLFGKKFDIRIGICFDLQLCSELPSEEHDCPVDYIVTNREIIRC